MILRADQIQSHLKNALAPIYVVYGDAPLLVIEATDQIRKAARAQGFDERKSLTVLPGFDWGELWNAANNLSLFGGKTLIDLQIPTGKPGREGATALNKYGENPPPDTVLLITLPALDWMDEKAVWFKNLSEAGTLLKLIPPKLNELPAWIHARLKGQNQSASAEALQFMAEHVEGNLLAAHQEIQKLALIYPARQLELAEIRESVLNVARYDIDSLREALLLGDVARFSRTLTGLQQEGETPVLILWALTEEIRTLMQLLSGLAENKSADLLLKEARIWGERQNLIKKALPRLTLNKTKAALNEAALIDQLIKGIDITGDGDIWNAFLRLGLRLMPQKRN